MRRWHRTPIRRTWRRAQAKDPVGPSFSQKAPAYMRRLMHDIPGLGVEDVAAIFGNLGHESAGLQVIKSYSGQDYGWAQWVGPRRRNLIAWCGQQGLDYRSDEGNYRFLVHELTTAYKPAISAVRRPGTLAAKVQRFERIFEVAGIKNYPSRTRYAQMALAAYQAAAKEKANA
jgi:Phage tail lysozyme